MNNIKLKKEKNIAKGSESPACMWLINLYCDKAYPSKILVRKTKKIIIKDHVLLNNSLKIKKSKNKYIYPIKTYP